MDRRSFTRISSLMGASFVLAGFKSGDILNTLTRTPPQEGKQVFGLQTDPIQQVRIGIIGLGNRGSSLLQHLAYFYPEKAIIKAICDVQPEKTKKALGFLDGKMPEPAVYDGKPDAWKSMIEKEEIDLVFVFTPWKEHVPMSVHSMKSGKHVAVEVPAACTVEDCWNLVNTAEETQKNCIMLENVCYGREELWVLNMVQNEIFGELTYAEAAYIHNLRSMLFDDSYYKKWRVYHHLNRHGNLYPTHGLGPVAQYLDIDRGDRFEKVVSMSSKEASLSEYSKTIDNRNEFYNQTGFKHGDMNTSLIKTNAGRSVMVQHDVVTPRPYSRINALAGTKAFHEGYPSRLAIDGRGHDWLPAEEYKIFWDKYQHPIWEELKDPIEKYGGHGGMDFVMLYRLIDAFNKGKPLDMDVYDAASWSVIGPLSEISVELSNVPVQFPDFTRGRWKEKRKLQILQGSVG
jgi:hypothetical protein